MNLRLPKRGPAFLRSLRHAASLIVLTALLGCGGGSDGPPRYQVTGTVTFQGRPVPAGTIVFEPDTERGNRGPAGGAIIEQGRYTTERGVIGGAHRVRITGNDGVLQKTSEEGFPAQGTPLFPEHHTTVDLPHEDGERDFSITESSP